MSETYDAPSETWRVMDRHQQTFGFLEGQTYDEARAAVASRLDLRPVAERGFCLRRLRENEVAAREQWAEARHPGDARTGPWSSYSLLLADGSYVLVTRNGSAGAGSGHGMPRTSSPAGTRSGPVQMTSRPRRPPWRMWARPSGWGCTSRPRAAASPGGRSTRHRADGGAASTRVPMPFEEAKATLVAELRRNLGRWAGWGGSDPARYREALATLEAATGPVTLDLPGHVLSVTEAEASGR